MGDTDIGNMNLEQRLTEEETKDIESLSPELAKVMNIDSQNCELIFQPNNEF